MEQLALAVHDPRERLHVQFPGDHLHRPLIARWDAVEETTHRVRRAPGRCKPFDARPYGAEFWRRHSIEAPPPLFVTGMPGLDSICASDNTACDTERVDRTLPSVRAHAPVHAGRIVRRSLVCLGGPFPVDHEDHRGLGDCGDRVRCLHESNLAMARRLPLSATIRWGNFVGRRLPGNTVS